jgi:hypothetical protein
VDYGFAICDRLYLEVGERGPMPHVWGLLRLPLALYAELVVALTSFLQTLAFLSFTSIIDRNGFVRIGLFIAFGEAAVTYRVMHVQDSSRSPQDSSTRHPPHVLQIGAYRFEMPLGGRRRLNDTEIIAHQCECRWDPSTRPHQHCRTRRSHP